MVDKRKSAYKKCAIPQWGNQFLFKRFKHKPIGIQNEEKFKMNLVCALLCSSMLFSGCLAANVNRESTNGDEQQQQQHQGSSANKTKPSGFNEDFQYAIFDNSDLQDILQFAKNPRYSELVIKHIFPVKYPNFDINVNVHEVNLHVEQFSSILYISGHDFFMDVIRLFGKSIHNLRIFGGQMLDDDRSAAVHRQVNEYCSDSLNSLFLNNFDEIVLEQFQKPFANVDKLNLAIKTDQFGSLATFDRLFPQLQRFHLSYQVSEEGNEPNSKRTIESDVPHMQHLQDLTVSVNINHNNYSELPIIQEQHRKLFENNPQIRRISYYIHKLDNFIHVISENLPNLEEMMIWDIQPDIQPVQFSSVKRLIVNSGAPTPIEKLSFPCLEAVDMIYCRNYANGSARDSWMTFLGNHQHIRQFNVSVHSGAESFVEFMSPMTNVEEIYIQSVEDIDIDIVSGLLAGHKYLKKLEYASHTNRPTEDAVAMFNEKFGKEWHVSISTADWLAFRFEKLN